MQQLFRNFSFWHGRILLKRRSKLDLHKNYKFLFFDCVPFISLMIKYWAKKKNLSYFMSSVHVNKTLRFLGIINLFGYLRNTHRSCWLGREPKKHTLILFGIFFMIFSFRNKGRNTVNQTTRVNHMRSVLTSGRTNIMNILSLIPKVIIKLLVFLERKIHLIHMWDLPVSIIEV